MNLSTTFELNPLSALSANGRKLLDQSGTKTQRDFSEEWPNLIRPGEAHNEFVHQIWAKSDQRFACKYAETAQSIRGQETVEIQWGMTKR